MPRCTGAEAGNPVRSELIVLQGGRGQHPAPEVGDLTGQRDLEGFQVDRLAVIEMNSVTEKYRHLVDEEFVDQPSGYIICQ